MTKYRTIVIDPPWQFDQTWGITAAGTKGFLAYTGERGTRSKPKRGAVANYNVMSIEQLEVLPLGDWAEDNAHLYLWTTNTFMSEALHLMKLWGFKQKTILTWIKPRLGMGTYFRNNTEHVLFGVKGSLKTLRKDQRTSFVAAQGGHSEKPAGFYDLVASMSPGPYLDVFARKQRFVTHGVSAGEKWDTWGNECFVAEGLAL